MKMHPTSRSLRTRRNTIVTVAFTSLALTPLMHAAAQAQQSAGSPQTPIEHVILIIGENRSFDHVWATYTAQAGQTVRNLLSEGVVNADGTPGPNFSKASQNQANVAGSTT
jgi:phospholipase C